MTCFLGMSDGEPERQRLCCWRTKINKLRGEAESRGFSRFLEIPSGLEAQRDEHVKDGCFPFIYFKKRKKKTSVVCLTSFQVDLMKNISNIPQPFLYTRHVHFLNFTR